jgi:DUF1680 family protein
MKKSLIITLLALIFVQSSAEKLKVLPLNQISVQGWIKNQMERDITSGYISVYDQIQPTMQGNVFGKVKAKNYSIDKTGNWVTRRETWWPGEHEGYFADAVVRNAFLTKNKVWMEKAKSIVDKVVAEQEVCGYIGIYDEECRLDNLLNENGELWTQSRMLGALLAYYEYSGEKKYFKAAQRAVDYTIMRYISSGKTYFGQPKPDGGGLTHGLMFAETVEWMYRLTNDKKYLNFAEWLYNDYSKAEPKLKNVDNQLGNLLDKEKMFSEHSVHIVEHTRVPFFLATEIKNSEYKNAVDNIFYKMKKSLAPTGAIVTDPDMHESVAGNYGSPTLGYEYCSITEGVISNASALQKFGLAQLGDEIENLAFNAGQGSRFADGKAICYLGFDNNFDAKESSGFRHQYAAAHKVACCNLNAAKLMPYYVANMWMKSQDEKTIFATLYGASEVSTLIDKTEVKIKEETNYPFENTIKFTVLPSIEKEFSIVLRNPAWSKNTTVVAAGAVISRKNGFISVRKKWNKGDMIELVLDDKIKINRFINNEFYISKGALIYALKIDETTKPTQKFINGLANYDTEPKDIAGAKLIFDNYKMQPNVDERFKNNQSLFKFIKNENYNPKFPFDTPYSFIETTMYDGTSKIPVKLIPFGSTLLRKTTFKENR